MAMFAAPRQQIHDRVSVRPLQRETSMVTSLVSSSSTTVEVHTAQLAAHLYLQVLPSRCLHGQGWGWGWEGNGQEGAWVECKGRARAFAWYLLAGGACRARAARCCGTLLVSWRGDGVKGRRQQCLACPQNGRVTAPTNLKGWCRRWARPAGKGVANGLLLRPGPAAAVCAVQGDASTCGLRRQRQAAAA